MKTIKNTSQNVGVWCGMEIQPGASYNIEDTELSRWQNDSQVLTDISNGILVLHNGNDITDVATAINYLKDTVVVPKDVDGAPLSRLKIAPGGWAYQILGFEIQTATNANGIYSNDHDGNANAYFTYKMYDVNGALTTTDAEAVKTVVDFEPPFDYEVIGGEIRQKTIPAEDVYYHVVAVPDIPANYGGSKVFASAIDLTFLNNGSAIRVDGRVPKRMVYSTVYHSNKIRFIFNHPAGFKHKVFQILEYFKP